MIAAPGFTQRQNARLAFWHANAPKVDTLEYHYPTDDADVLFAVSFAVAWLETRDARMPMSPQAWRVLIDQTRAQDRGD